MPTRYSRVIDVAGRGEKSERFQTWKQVLNCSKLFTADRYVWYTWYRRATDVKHTSSYVFRQCLERLKTQLDALRRECLALRFRRHRAAVTRDWAVEWQWSGSGVAALRTRSTRDQHAVSSAIDAMKPRYRRDEAAVSLGNATFSPCF